MRASYDTDRTQVPTRQNSVGHMDHMDALEEKKTNMDDATPHQPTSLERLASRRQYDDTFDGIDVVDGTRVDNTSNSSLASASADRDIEKEAEAKGTTPHHTSPPQKPRDPNLIEWDGPDDPENPMNWSNRKKWITTMALGCMTFCVTFASSVFSNATVPVAKLYHVSNEVSTLGTSLFVLGFAVGPMQVPSIHHQESGLTAIGSGDLVARSLAANFLSSLATSVSQSSRFLSL